MRMRLTGTGALRRLGVGALTMAFVIGLAGMEPAQAGGTLRVAMSASDVPLPNGQTDQGAEGMRFMGYSLFEALVAYDLSSRDKPVTLIPGLATEWSVDASDKTRWTFIVCAPSA